MIKQVQENQLAITNNLNRNRLAIEFDRVVSPPLPPTKEEIAVARPKPPIPPKPKIMTLTHEDLNRYFK